MQPLRAYVHNGRLVLDEPTTLPEGDVVELVSIEDAFAHGGDGLEDLERAALHNELSASVAEENVAPLVDADVVLADLRTMQ